MVADCSIDSLGSGANIAPLNYVDKLRSSVLLAGSWVKTGVDLLMYVSGLLKAVYGQQDVA